MKNPGRWLLALAFILPAAPLAAADDVREVENTLHLLCDAFRTADIATLERLLDPQFTLIASDAVQTSREQEIASLREGRAVYEVFRNHHMATRIHGDVAVVNGITSVAGTWDGQTFKRDLRFTDTLQKRGGDWILLSSHATPIPEQALRIESGASRSHAAAR